jgi:hypothetical protein
MSNNDNNNNNNNNNNNSTTARMLMQAGGQSGKITGLSLSTVSTMYIMKYLLTAGCATIEYLPHVFNPKSSASVVDHFSSQMNSSWSAVLITCGVLLTGVVVRKLGTNLSDDNVIQSVEGFMYNTGASANANDD